MILSGDVDYKGSDVCGMSCIAPGDIGRRETNYTRSDGPEQPRKNKSSGERR